MLKNCYIFAKSLHFFTFHSILPSISDFLQLKHLPLYAVELGVVQCAVNPLPSPNQFGSMNGEYSDQ